MLLFPTPTDTIYDLSTLTESTEASNPNDVLPFPLTDSWDLKTTDARTYRNLNKHVSASPALFTGTSGIATVGVWIRNPGMFVSSAPFICQILNGATLGTQKAEFQVGMISGDRLRAIVYDTSSTSSNRIQGLSSDISGLGDLTRWNLVVARFRALNTDPDQTADLFFNGVNLNVGQTQFGTGVTNFNGGSIQPEFSIGNYGSGSLANGGSASAGSDISCGRAVVWNNIFLTDKEISSYYSNELGLMQTVRPETRTFQL